MNEETRIKLKRNADELRSRIEGLHLRITVAEAEARRLRRELDAPGRELHRITSMLASNET